jgi:hypothetical protein
MNMWPNIYGRVQTLKQTEGVPATYPSWTDTSPTLANPDPKIWQRIESYIAWRWTARSIIWVVEGPGEWAPPLAPATITLVEWWSSDNVWTAPTPQLDPGPLGGYVLPCTGPYRFTGTINAGTVPVVVRDAYFRLANYVSQNPGKPGASVESLTLGAELMQRIERDPAHIAKAMQNSGAADLLRAYRRA